MKKEHKPEDPNRPLRIWRLVAIIVCGSLGIMFVICATTVVLILRTTPPPSIHTDPTAAKRLQEKLQKAQIAASEGQRGSVQADETEVNSALQTYLQAENSKLTSGATDVRDVKFKLIDDRIRVHLLLNVRGKDISMDCEGAIHAKNGYLEFEPISAKLGSLAIPASSLKRAVQQFMSVPENREQLRLPGNVKEIRVENGQIVLTYD